MRPINVILINAIAVSLFFNCSNKENNNPVSSNGADSESQTLLVVAEFQQNYWDEIQGYVPSTEVAGMILGNPLPAFDYCKVGDSTFTDHRRYLSYIYFEYDHPAISGKMNPLKFEAKTSRGVVNGAISLPDTITSVSLSSNQRIPIGQPLTISWYGSNADFYFINGYYSWTDVNRNTQYVELDTFVVGNSVTYDAAIFTHTGRIRIYNITPFNGPIPVAGSEANLSGEGTGFLYYSNTKFDVDADIQVGPGLRKSSSSTSLEEDTSRKKEDFRLEILQRLGYQQVQPLQVGEW